MPVSPDQKNYFVMDDRTPTQIHDAVLRNINTAGHAFTVIGKPGSKDMQVHHLTTVFEPKSTVEQAASRLILHLTGGRRSTVNDPAADKAKIRNPLETLKEANRGYKNYPKRYSPAGVQSDPRTPFEKLRAANAQAALKRAPQPAAGNPASRIAGGTRGS